MFTIDHANINVTDLERSIKFYNEAFGLKEARRMKAPDGSFMIAFLSDGATDFMLELTWLKGKERYNLGDNENHICFTADDYEAAHALHEKMGIICYENKAMGIHFVNDPDGYWQEVKPKKR